MSYSFLFNSVCIGGIHLLLHHTALATGQSQPAKLNASSTPALNLVSKGPWVAPPWSARCWLTRGSTSAPGRENKGLRLKSTGLLPANVCHPRTHFHMSDGSTSWSHTLHGGGSSFGNKYKRNPKESTFKEETDMTQPADARTENWKSLHLDGVNQIKTTRP